VVGGVTTSSSGAYQASDIDSATGNSVASGGDIPAAQTHVAAARTLGVALGIPESQVASDFVSSAGGKVVKAALVGP
jgi:hypothetical protein